MIIPAIRGRDVWGSGYYGASRGYGAHCGVDFVWKPDTEVRSFVSGTVTKLGHAYSDDLSYRYVELQTSDEKRVRYFYVDPLVALGDLVERGAVVGMSQALGRRYENITEHVHFEVFTPQEDARQYHDPLAYLGEL